MLLEDREEKFIKIWEENVYHIEMYWYLSEPAVANLLNVAQVVARDLKAGGFLCPIKKKKTTLTQLPFQNPENITVTLLMFVVIKKWEQHINRYNLHP